MIKFLLICIISHQVTISQLELIQKLIELPFTILPSKNKTLESLLHLNFLSKIDLLIGTPPQKKKILFDPSSSLTYLLNAEYHRDFPNENTTYDSFQSSTKAETNKALYLYSNQQITSATQFLDMIQLHSIKLPQALLFLAHQGQTYLSYSSIGLFADTPHSLYTSFLNQLMKNGDIDHKSYTIEWINEDEGLITIGKKDFSKKKSIYVKDKEIRFVNDKEKDSPNCYVRLFDIGDYHNKIIEEKFNAFLDLSFRFIQLPMRYKKSVISKILYKTEFECEEINETIQFRRSNLKYYSYYICDKISIDMRKVVNDIKFVIDDNTVMTLNKEDYFIEYDNERVMFAFIFMKQEASDQWIIGRPILKRYTIEHDFELHKLSFYLKQASYSTKTMIVIILSLINIILNFIMIVVLVVLNSHIIKNYES